MTTRFHTVAARSLGLCGAHMDDEPWPTVCTRMPHRYGDHMAVTVRCVFCAVQVVPSGTGTFAPTQVNGQWLHSSCALKAAAVPPLVEAPRGRVA